MVARKFIPVSVEENPIRKTPNSAREMLVPVLML
jgi:hypothetical protein